MTIDEFLVKLNEIKGLYNWAIYPDGIRGTIKNLGRKPLYYEDFVCPITAVAQVCFHYHCGIYQFKKSGQFIGLKEENTLEIMEAADTKKESILRQKMIKTLNLKEHIA